MSFDATPFGTPSFVVSETGFGLAAQLNGSSQYFSIAQAVLRPVSGETWTLRARFKTSSSSGIQIILGNASVGFIGITGGLPFANATGSGYTGITGLMSVSDNAWHEMELNLGTTSAALYIDGVSVGSQAGTYSPGSAEDWSIGGGVGSFAAFLFNGLIDEAALFSSRQHTGDYTPLTAPISNDAPDLAALYHLDGDGSDSSGGDSGATNVYLTTPGGTDILIIEPPGYDPDVSAKLVFYFGGNGEDRNAWNTDALKTGIRDILLDNGYLLASLSAGATAWGNDASLAKCQDAYTYVMANRIVTLSGALPQSMGGLCGFRSINDSVSFPRLQCGYSIYPVADILAEYDLGTFASQILTAWSVSTRAELVTAIAGKYPLGLAASGYAGRSYRFHHSPDDAIVPKAANTDAMRSLLATTSTVENSLVVTEGNHGDVSNFDPEDALAFFERAIIDPSGNPNLGGFFF